MQDSEPNPRAIGLAAVLVVAATLWQGLHPLSDLDIWWHLRTGEQMLATGTLLPTDPFSFTAAQTPWPYKDAGFAISAHLLWTIGGAAALVIAKGVGFVALAALLWRLLRHGRSLPPSLAVLGVALAMDGTAYRFTERAASVSLVILAAVLVLIERDRQGHRGLPWVIALTVVGANMHRGVVVLPVVLGAYAAVSAIEAALERDTHAAERWRRNVVVAIMSGLACLATPFHIALFTTSTNLLGEHTAMLTEWAPVSFELVWALTPSSLLVVGAVVLAAVLMIWRERPLPLWELALVGLALALGLGSMRHLPYLALLGIGPAARAVAHWQGWIQRVGGLAAVAGALAMLASAIGKPLPPPSLGLAPHHYPERGVGFIAGLSPEQRLRGNMFNDFGYGGYLVFHLWPEYRVFIDGRTDLIYTPEHVQAYMHALEDPAVFAAQARQYEIEWVILDNAPHLGARAHLDANPQWTLVHASRRAVIYVRTTGANATLAETHGYRTLWAHDLDGSVVRAVNAGYGAQVVAELRRMAEEDPDNIYALGTLARLTEQLNIALPTVDGQ